MTAGYGAEPYPGDIVVGEAGEPGSGAVVRPTHPADVASAGRVSFESQPSPTTKETLTMTTTRYTVDARVKRFTVRLRHDSDCEYEDEAVEIRTFGGYLRDALVTDVRHDLRDEAARDRSDVWSFLITVNPGQRHEYRLWQGGRVGGVIHLDRSVWSDMARAREAAGLVLAEYEDWANGDCYGIEILDETGAVVESTWGYIGDEWVVQAAQDEWRRWNPTAPADGAPSSTDLYFAMVY